MIDVAVFEWGAENATPRAWTAKPDHMMRVMGRPNREQVVTSRPSRLTSLQAIEVLNGEGMVKMLDRGAARMLDEGEADPNEFIDQVYLRALSRTPNRAERRIAREFIGDPISKEGVEDFLWAIFSLPDFQLIY